MIFHIFSIPFLPWVFHKQLFKVLRKKNEIHCMQLLVFLVELLSWQNIKLVIAANVSLF